MRFSPQDFHIIPGGFCYLPGGKFTARSRKFFKIWSFPWWVKPSPPGYWDRAYPTKQCWYNLILNYIYNERPHWSYSNSRYLQTKDQFTTVVNSHNYSNFMYIFSILVVSKFLPHFVQVTHLTCFWKKNLFLYTHRCNPSLMFLLKISTHFPHKQNKMPCYQKLLNEGKVKLADIFLWKCRLFQTSRRLINLGHILDMKDLGVILEKQNTEEKRQMLTKTTMKIFR